MNLCPNGHEVEDGMAFCGHCGSPVAQMSTDSIRSVGTGTRDDPMVLGASADVGEGWTVKVTAVDFDAVFVVAAENEFNDPPPRGEVLVMATVGVTYGGSEQRANPDVNLRFTAVGDRNVEYSNSALVLPNDLSRCNDLFQGGSESGNVCWSVLSADLDSLVMVVEPTYTSELTFFALR